MLRLLTLRVVRQGRRSPQPHTRTRLSLEQLEDRNLLSDTSAPVILQVFDGSYKTIEGRAPDVFNAGYGAVYSPPPGRADSGNQSVGYDVYNRFDLGSAGNPTLYGTETGLKTAVAAVHQFGGNYYLDLVWNHDGFKDLGSVDGQGHSFPDAGGYPGFYLTPGYTAPTDGDFHKPDDTGGTHGRLAGLIDIAHETDYQFVRNPVPGNANDLPAGTTAAFGRLANVPDANNTRFYPDTNLQPIFVSDPITGEQNIAIYPFNNDNPLNGTPVSENALGYLMRNAQWLVQYAGVDGFRIDAAKNMDPWVLNYLDRAVYRSSFRTLLNGSQQPVFSFSEVYDGSKSFLQQFVRKDINPNNPGQIGGNRDVLDFPLFFAMQTNLSNNGFQNDWRNLVNASQDSQDDGLANNGSQGVAFVSSQDNFGPYLGNVAYAYTLMRPGNEAVYFNAKEFGSNRDFPKDGRGDALGGLYGDTLTKLIDIRNTHGRGNYLNRDVEKDILIFERDKSMLFAGNNRLDGGYDSRTVQTDFAAGTPLIELTGNAGDPTVDPYHDLPPLVVVNADHTVNLRVPRNRNPNGVEDDKGYVIYGLAGPQGTLSVTNVDHVIPGQTPTAATNGTARLSPIDVIDADTFQIRMDTNQVNLLGSTRDHDADGDNALFMVDGGVALNGDSQVDYRTPGTTTYGFEDFHTVHSPGYYSANGNGQYVQTIDATTLGDGLHYLTVRVFRHRGDGGPAVYTDFCLTFYVDRSKPVSAVVGFDPIVDGVNENRRVTVRSTDLRGNSVHVFLDLPAGLTDAQVAALVGAGNKAAQIDRDLFTKDFAGLTNGNHVLTVVTYEITGRYNVQRFAGFSTATIYGAGLGDLNFDGTIDAADVNLFGQVLASNNGQFNPAADFNGDGRIDTTDLLLLYQRLLDVNADDATLAAYNTLLGPPSAGYTTSEGGGLTLTVNLPGANTPGLTVRYAVNGGDYLDATNGALTLTYDQLVSLGAGDDGVYVVQVLVTNGGASVVFDTVLTMLATAPTATFVNDGPAPAGSPVTLSFLNSYSPSPADMAAGFSYSYDFDNTGAFDLSNVADASVTHVFTTPGQHTVHGRIQDKDGAFTDYYTMATVL